MRRKDDGEDAGEDAWVALWNGDAAHPPDATGMCAAIVAPLAAGAVPVWVAASYDGDLVLVPATRVEEAVELLRRGGHAVPAAECWPTCRKRVRAFDASARDGHMARRR